MNVKRKKLAGLVLAALAVLILAWKLVARREFLYAGTIEATEIDVPARVASVISSIEVKEGEAVRRGQVLVRLAGEDIRLAADLAERNYLLSLIHI